MSQQTVSNVCKRVALAVAKISKNYIKMPTDLDEQEEVIRNFEQVSGFRSVIGAIDCTHIKIKKVSGDSGQFYVNRKGWYSLNVQVRSFIFIFEHFIIMKPYSSALSAKENL